MIYRNPPSMTFQWWIPGKFSLVIGDRTLGYRIALSVGKRVLVKWRYRR